MMERLGSNLEFRRGSAFPAWFVVSAAAILVVTGVAKVWSLTAPAKVLGVSDPITGIPFGHLMLAAGILELVIAGVCLLVKSQKLALGLIAWLATNFMVYRLGLWWMGWTKSCSCLGNLTDALHLSPQFADNVMKVILAYLLIGSYGLLFWQWRQGARKLENSAGVSTPRLQALSSIEAEREVRVLGQS